MSYLVKQQVFYYKKFRIDIWNAFKNTLQVTHSSVFRKLKNTYKRTRKLKGAFRYFNRLYKRFKKEFFECKQQYVEQKKNLFNQLIIYAQKKLLQKKKMKLRYLNFNRSKRYIKILIRSNLSRFLTQTVSCRSSALYKPFVDYEDNYQKVFFRRHFVYEAQGPIIKRKKRRFNEQFVSFRFIKIFYVMYTYRQLKQIAIKAKLKSGVFEQNYLQIIECKLPSYLYRTAFFPTIFEGIDFVKTSNVWVNKEFKPLIHYSVRLFDIIGFRILYKSYVLWCFFRRLRRRAFAFMFSRCIYVSLRFLFTMLISRFMLDDLVNSFDFDYYRIARHIQ